MQTYGAFATYYLLSGLQVVPNSIVCAMVPLLHIAVLFYFQVYKLYSTPLSVLWCLCYILLYFSTSRFTSCTQLHCPCYGAFATYCCTFLLSGLQVVPDSIVCAKVPLLHIAVLFYFQVYKLYSTPLSVLWCLCYILLYFSTSRFTSCTQLHCPCYGAFATYCSTFLLPGLQVVLSSIVRAMVPLLHIALLFYFQVYKLYSTPLSVLWCLCYILLYFPTSRFTSCTRLHCPCYCAFATYCSTFLLPGLQVVLNSIVCAMVPLLHIALFFYFQVHKLYSTPLSVLLCLCYILLYFSTSRFTSCTQLHCPCYGAFATYCSTFLLPGLQVELSSIVHAMVPLLHIALLFYFQVYKLNSAPLSMLWCLCYILLYFSTSRFTSCTQLHCPCYGAFATYCSTFLLPGLQVELNSISVLWCLCYILLYFSTSRFTSCTQLHCPCYGAFATYCSTFLLPGLQVVLSSIVRAMVPLLHIALLFYFQVYKLYSTPLSVLWCLCYILLYFPTSRLKSCTQLHCPCYCAFATYCSTFLLPGLQVVLSSIVRAMVPLLHIALLFYFQVYKLYSTPLSVLWCLCYILLYFPTSRFTSCTQLHFRALVPLLHIAVLFYFQVYKLYSTPLSVLWCLCYILLYFSTSRFTSCTQLHCPCYGAFATYCSIFLLPGLQVVLNSIVRAMVPLLHIALFFYFQVYKLYSTPLSVLWCLCYILLYFSTSRFTSCTQLHCPCYGAFATYCSTCHLCYHDLCYCWFRTFLRETPWHMLYQWNK